MNNKGDPKAAFVFESEVSPLKCRNLQCANVLCLPALLAFGHSKFNRLAFFQTTVAIALNGGEMHENIFSTLTRDKTEAFGGIEPLNCSLFHFSIILCLLLTLE